MARVRREKPGETFPFDTRPDPFGRRPTPLAPPQPTDPDFIPNEYGTGVVVGPGLILTVGSLLGDESDYYVTTAEHKVYKATVKAADPRSDLAVLAIDAVNLPPIAFGNADDVKRGQIVISLGNPWAIARDGQPSASWGIVANLHRKAPASPSEADPTGRPTLHHYGTLIQTDARLNLGTSGGPLLESQGRDDRPVRRLGRRAGRRGRRRIRHARRCDLPPRGREAHPGPRGRVRLPRRSAGQFAAAGGPRRPARAAGGAVDSRHARRSLRTQARRHHHRRGPDADLRLRRADTERRQAAAGVGRAIDRAPRRQRADDPSHAEQVRGPRPDDCHRSAIRRGGACGSITPRRWSTTRAAFPAA